MRSTSWHGALKILLLATVYVLIVLLMVLYFQPNDLPLLFVRYRVGHRLGGELRDGSLNRSNIFAHQRRILLAAELQDSSSPLSQQCDPAVKEKFLACAEVTRMSGREKELALYTLFLTVTLFQAFNVTNFAYFGSLLGAVRHQDLIPWDDDVDLVVLGRHQRFVSEQLFSRPSINLPKSSRLSAAVTVHMNRRLRQLATQFGSFNHTNLAVWMRELDFRHLEYSANEFHPKVFLFRSECQTPRKSRFCWPYTDLFYAKEHHSFVRVLEAGYIPKWQVFPTIPFQLRPFLVLEMPRRWQQLISLQNLHTCCTNDFQHRSEQRTAGDCVVCAPCRCVQAAFSDQKALLLK